MELLCCFFWYCSCWGDSLHSICSGNVWVISEVVPQYLRVCFFSLPTYSLRFYLLLPLFLYPKGMVGIRSHVQAMLDDLESWTFFFPDILLHLLYKSSLQLMRTQSHSHWGGLLGIRWLSVSPLFPFSPLPLFLSQKRNWIIKWTQFPFLHIWKFLWEFSDFCEPTIMVSGKLRAGFCPSCVFHHHFIPKSAVSYCNRLCLFPYLVVW